MTKIRIEGMSLLTPNATRFTTRGAAMAHARAKRTVRDCVQMHVAAVWRRRADGLPCSILVTRIGPGTLDDDNLVASLKDPLDGIALALGVNDRTFVLLGDREGIRIEPRQRSEGRGRYALEVQFMYAEDC